jgi:hypothetical protein
VKPKLLHFFYASLLLLGYELKMHWLNVFLAGFWFLRSVSKCVKPAGKTALSKKEA